MGFMKSREILFEETVISEERMSRVETERRKTWVQIERLKIEMYMNAIVAEVDLFKRLIDIKHQYGDDITYEVSKIKVRLFALQGIARNQLVVIRGRVRDFSLTDNGFIAVDVPLASRAEVTEIEALLPFQ